jgi:electron-transferring-flavoprotein dehydrogenase
MDNVDTVYTDVLIVGGGPSGLAASIHLADIINKKGQNHRILLIDKGNSIGSHILSGAVIRPEVFKQLLPDVDFNEIPFNAKVTKDATVLLSENGSFQLPFPVPYMSNKGNYTASLGQICRYLAKKAEEKGVEIYPGFSISDLLYRDGKVIGAKTIDTGVDHHGNPMENFQPGTRIEAKLTILAEGTRGSLTKKLINQYKLDKGKNAQSIRLASRNCGAFPKEISNPEKSIIRWVIH